MRIRISLILFFPLVLLGQEIEWMVGFGGIQSDIAGTIITTSDEGFYISGYFSGEANFELLGGENNLQALFNQEYFLCRYNSDLELLWNKSLGAALWATPAISITENDKLITRYEGLVNNTDEFIIIEVYNSDGSNSWSLNQDFINVSSFIPNKTISLIPSFNQRCDDMSYDEPVALVNIGGDCIGQFYIEDSPNVTGTVVYHSYASIGLSTKILLSSIGETNLQVGNQEINIGEGNLSEDTYEIKTYILEIDSGGNYVDHSLLNTGAIQDLSGVQNWYFIDRVTADSENIFTAGFTRGTYNFGEDIVFANGPVIQKIDSNNDLIWTKEVRTINGELNEIKSINVSDENLVISGVFSDAIDIDISESGEKIITSGTTGTSSYIGIYNQDGNYLKHYVYNDLSISSIGLNSDNTLYSFGNYSKENLSFETKSGTYDLPHFGQEDLFIQKIDFLQNSNVIDQSINIAEVYPNPSLGNVFIRVSGTEEYHGQIFDSCGKLVLEQSLLKGVSKIELINKGIYVLKFLAGDKRVEIHKIIIN